MIRLKKMGVYRYKNGFGGGIWFGKRKKRSAGNMNSNLIINAISEFETKYEDDKDWQYKSMLFISIYLNERK